ncbi:MAG: hypothetical protein GX630_06985 [Actinobacteria bacterium]|nr:hypothetical protein [Actinomycetota bacterium]
MTMRETAAEKAVALMDPARNELCDLYDREYLIAYGFLAGLDIPMAIAAKLKWRGLVV